MKWIRKGFQLAIGFTVLVVTLFVFGILLFIEAEAESMQIPLDKKNPSGW